VDGVVAAQTVALGQLSRDARERLVDADDAQLLEQSLDATDRCSRAGRVEPAGAPGGRDGGARLRVGELPGGERRRALPDLRGDVGAVLVDDELDERGGVEVGVQRSSSSSSETEPRALTRLRGSQRLVVVGSRTRPRARRSESGSASATGTIRATGRPRMVTVTSAPSATCWT
jgi:hypothetical protein